LTDITAESSCSVEAVEYADEAYTQVISRATLPCPAGSVTHVIPMALVDARASGLPFVVTTGNGPIDKAAVDALQNRLLAPSPEVQAATAKTARKAAPALFSGVGSARVGASVPSASHCPATNRSRSVSYTTGEVGVSVSAFAYYSLGQSTNCDQWLITQSQVYTYCRMAAGQDLYWDQLYYDGSLDANNASRDAGCQRQWNSSSLWKSFSLWWIYLYGAFRSESINDTSFGCDWWGEEYSGTVWLY
jgi:hypothetical protein